MPSPSLARSSSAPPHAERLQDKPGGTGTAAGDGNPPRAGLPEERTSALVIGGKTERERDRDHRGPPSKDAGMDTERKDEKCCQDTLLMQTAEDSEHRAGLDRKETPYVAQHII